MFGSDLLTIEVEHWNLMCFFAPFENWSENHYDVLRYKS